MNHPMTDAEKEVCAQNPFRELSNMNLPCSITFSRRELLKEKADAWDAGYKIGLERGKWLKMVIAAYQRGLATTGREEMGTREQIIVLKQKHRKSCGVRLESR